MAMTTPTTQTVYDRITANIIEALERGVAPWVRPWAVSLPHNAVSGREYNGVNILYQGRERPWRADSRLK
jgi:antirestriction protein ArdC